MTIDTCSEKQNILATLDHAADYDILFENGLPKRPDGDGVGINSILASSARYGGDTMFSTENGVFTCAVLLNNRS